MIIDKYNYYLV